MRKFWTAALATPLTLAVGVALGVAPATGVAAATAGGTRTVVVLLRAQTDLSAVRSRPSDIRLQETVTLLQDLARKTQGPLLARLRTLAASGKVTDVTPLWITDAVSVTATDDVVAELTARSDVARVVPDAVVLTSTAGAPEPNQTRIRAPGLWDLGQTGEGVVVATLDSGVDGTHPDLAGRWRGGTNSWFDPYGQHPSNPTDLTGHGTATTGVMVGGDAGGTSIGTAPGATWIAAKIFDDAGRATLTAVHEAFQWVLDPDHDLATNDAPQVVNGSWSLGTGPGCDLSLQPDVQALRAAGILPVFAAGNYGPGGATSVSPANYPESLSVGALTGTDLVLSSSSRGPSTCGGRTRVFPDVVAPGEGVYTTDRYGLYQYASGTSVAAPHVAGALALLLGARPGLTPDQQLQAVAGTARDLGEPGPDDVYGNGLVDAVAAYDVLPPPPPPQPGFALAVDPGEATVPAGGTATFTVQVSPENGWTQDVSLALSGLDPSQGSATFTPAVLTGGGSSTLVVATAPTLPTGVHQVTVTASGGGISRSAGATLTVTAPTISYSTMGNANPPGVSGTADDADVLVWNGTAHSRAIDVSAPPYNLPSSANVDGLDRVGANQFYVSFSEASTSVPGLGKVQDEDIVMWDGAGWSLWFDGTAHGLTSNDLDVDALSVAGGTTYFSTLGDVRPPGIAGTPDDADVYRYDGGSTYTRVWDATAYGLPGAADVDGLVWIGPGQLYLSFSPTTTTVPGLGKVQDEDVVLDRDGAWTVFFDGTAHGLTTDNLDLDAFDLG